MPTSFLKWISRALFLGAALALVSGCAHQAKPEKPGYVIQVSDNDPGKWNLALNNAKNVRAEQPDADIEIVAYGPGLNMLRLESEVAGRLDDAKKSNVKIIACGNTMKGMKVSKEDLHPVSEVVKAGVLEIGDKQQKGWTYVRP